MNDLLKIEPPIGRVFSTGDLHGNYDKLMDALDDVNFDESSDILVTVWDLIDRGPKPAECLDLLKEPWFFSTIGNHEHMMFESTLRSGSGQTYRCWLMHGGGWWPFGQNPPDDVVKTLKYWQSRLPLRIQVGNVGWVHSRPPKQWDDPQPDDSVERMVWDRSWFGKPVIVGGIDMVVVGHTPTKGSIDLQQNILYTDTGVGFEQTGVKLTDVTEVVRHGATLGKLQMLYG